MLALEVLAKLQLQAKPYQSSKKMVRRRIYMIWGKFLAAVLQCDQVCVDSHTGNSEKEPLYLYL